MSSRFQMCVFKQCSWSWQQLVPLEGLRHCADASIKRGKHRRRNEVQIPWCCHDDWWVLHHQFSARALVLVLPRSNPHFTSRGQIKVKILCYRSRDFGQEGTTRCQGNSLLVFLSLACGPGEDTCLIQPVLRICLNNGCHHPKVPSQFTAASVNSAHASFFASIICSQCRCQEVSLQLSCLQRKSCPRWTGGASRLHRHSDHFTHWNFTAVYTSRYNLCIFYQSSPNGEFYVVFWALHWGHPHG